jgi:hypothetical protein
MDLTENTHQHYEMYRILLHICRKSKAVMLTQCVYCSRGFGYNLNPHVQYNFLLFNYYCYSSFKLLAQSVQQTGYRLENGGVRVRVPVTQKFSLVHVVQTGSRVHPTSYAMGSAEVKKMWIYTSIPHTPSWHSA